MTGPVVSSGWEALVADPLPWLLDDEAPGSRWRTLVELVGRDEDSPAARRARGGANAVDPVASLLEPLQPDGRWDGAVSTWHRFRGPGWRLLAALELGADPTDPRLQAAAERLVVEATGSGGFAEREGDAASPVVTARATQTLCALGWGSHLRVQEALAWLEEEALSPGCGTPNVVVAVGALRAAAITGRGPLWEAGRRVLLDQLGRRAPRGLPRYAHPRLARSDELEVLWALARSGASFDPRMGPALARLQDAAEADGRWVSRVAPPPSLPVALGPVGAPCRWLTLRAAVVLLRYAAEAGLPRRFPHPPR